MGAGSPQLWVVAGIHGDEYEGIACAIEAVRTIRPDRGSVVAVPLAYPAAVSSGTRHGPDGLDLNRSFPGDPGGSLTERVASKLWRAVTAEAAALLTIHSWHRSGYAGPYAEFRAGDIASAELARTLGMRWAEPLDWHPGLLPSAVSRSGLPAVELELGGLGAQSSAMLAVGVEAVRRAAAWLGMISPEPQTRPTTLVQRETVCAPVAGLVRQLRPIGSAIKAGESIAEIAAGDELRMVPVTARAAGVMAVHWTYGAVQAGAPIAVVFSPLDGHPVS